MEIGTSTPAVTPGAVPSGVNESSDQEAPRKPPLPDSGEATAYSDKRPDGKITEVDFKEAATEMISKIKMPGDFKDRKGLDEIKDMKIGPDIRYAIKAANLDYLKRVVWGPLTIAEFREVKHRISELEREMSKNSRDELEAVHHKLPELGPGAAVETAA